jgi:predicted transcriptional regulator
LLADVAFHGGLIDAWGRGITKIAEACQKADLPPPTMAENSGGFLVTVKLPDVQANPAERELVKEPVEEPVGEPVAAAVIRFLQLLANQKSLGTEGIRKAFNHKSRKHLRETYIHPALAQGLVEMTLPDKPNSRLQKYRLTAKGAKMTLIEEPVKEPVEEPVTEPVADAVIRFLQLLANQKSLGTEGIRKAFNHKSRKHLRETYIHPALARGLVEMTLPDKPNSRLQKYRLTAKGAKMALIEEPVMEPVA